MANRDTLNARKKLLEEHMRAENAHDITATIAILGRQPRYVLNGMIIEGCEAIYDAYEGKQSAIFRAYPNNPAALKAMRAQAKWRNAR